LLQQLCTVGSGIFLYSWCKHIFVSELNNEYLPDSYLKKVFEWLSFTLFLLPVLFEHCDFLSTDILQGSVATYLVQLFKYDFVANLPVSLPVK